MTQALLFKVVLTNISTLKDMKKNLYNQLFLLLEAAVCDIKCLGIEVLKRSLVTQYTLLRAAVVAVVVDK